MIAICKCINLNFLSFILIRTYSISVLKMMIIKISSLYK